MEMLINVEEGLERVLGRRDIYRRWLDDFFSGATNEIMSAVMSAAAANDGEKMHFALHKLKGTAANLSLTMLAQKAAELDEHIKAGKLPSELGGLSELEAIFNATKGYYFGIRNQIQ